MSEETEVDIWVICPNCKTKLKKENLQHHMKHVHNKKMDDAKIESFETSQKKRRENTTPRFISKMTIAVITIICVVVVASISIYFLSHSKDSNVQIDKKSIFVSLDGTGNYSSIQEAIDSANDNDTIFISNGTYFENIKIRKSIELIGEDKSTTIINGSGSGSVVNISADYVKIRGLTIKNGGPKSASEPAAGIEIRSNYNTISDCNITSNKNYGLYLEADPEATNNIIKFNTFSNNKYGIFAYNASINNISSNTIINNSEYGMYLDSYSEDNLVSDNTFKENNYAMRIKSSDKNTVIKNLIMNNQKGLYFCCGAQLNIAYDNIFKSNAEWNAEDGGTNNAWNNRKVGNYWDDYTGTDANGDGIGDTPYQITGDIVDRFPLMEPK